MISLLFKYIRVGFFLLLFTPILTYCQDIDGLSAFKPKTQLLLSSTLNRYNKLKIENSGKDWLKSKSAIGGSLGFGISQVLFDNLSIIVGGDLTIIGHNFNYNFNSNVQHSEIENNIQDLNHYDYNSFTSWNAGISYIFDNYQFSNNLFPVISMGIKYNRMLTYEISVGSGYFINENEPNVRIFDFEMTDFDDTTEEDFHFISYYIKLGILKQKKKLNTIQLNILYNYSSDKIGKGIYKFSNLEHESNGSFDFGVNYVGLEFIYGFTFFKPKNK